MPTTSSRKRRNPNHRNFLNSLNWNNKNNSIKTIIKCASTPPPLTPDKEENGNGDGQRKVSDLQTLYRRFREVAAPYWFIEDKAQARLHLAAVFALTLGITGISVGFSFLGRGLYNAIAS